MAATRTNGQKQTQVRLQLPGRRFPDPAQLSPGDALNEPAWPYWQPDGEPIALAGTWSVEFQQGGPTLPKGFETAKLASWTDLGGEDAKAFAGTARYRLVFDAPIAGTSVATRFGPGLPERPRAAQWTGSGNA